MQLYKPSGQRVSKQAMEPGRLEASRGAQIGAFRSPEVPALQPGLHHAARRQLHVRRLRSGHRGGHVREPL